MAPNILLVLTDDHAQWALGCYGNGEIRTPAMDALAAGGVRMANAFAVTPVCSPSRATLLTGRLPSQHGIHDWLLESAPFIGNRNWQGSEVTLAQILANRGRYSVGLSGKWHCGRSHLPQPGFGYWFSTGRTLPPHRGEHRYRFQDQTLALSGFSSHILTQRALTFLRKRNRQRPFLLVVGHTATHSPWKDQPERWSRAYKDATFVDLPEDAPYPFGLPTGEALLVSAEQQRDARIQYYAAVSDVDQQVGMLVDELDIQGILDDTVIVYASDHGLNCGQHRLWGKGNASRPLNMLEESIRIPLLVHYPRGIASGSVRSEFVDHTDLFQTLLDFAGVSLSEATRRRRRYPGRSFRQLLEGHKMADWRTDQFGEYGNVRMIRTATTKLVRQYPDGPHELFDLVSDPRETNNLFATSSHQGLVAQLTTRLETFFATHQNPDKSGLRVVDLPRHNNAEAWRSGGGGEDE